MKKILRKTLCLILVMIMALGSAFAVFAEGGDQYISELKIEHAATPEEAKAKLEAAGYTVFEQDLNQTNGGDYSYLGYKTTRNPDEGITKISAMNMDGGFENLSYKDIVQGQIDGINKTAGLIKDAAAQLGRNYQAGMKNAKLAIEVLNTFDIDGAPLGNYLIDGSRKVSDFTDIILICDGSILSAIYTQLTVGVVSDTTSGEDSWMKALSDRGVLDNSDIAEEDGTVSAEMLEAKYKEDLDPIYLSNAKNIWDSVKLFATSYKDALKRHPDGSFTLAEAGIDVNGNESRTATKDKALDDAEDGRNNELSEGNDDYKYLSLYKTLDAKNEDGSYIYPYGKNADGSDRSLAQFFVGVGSANPDNAAEIKAAYRELYPLLMVLNDAQETMLRFSGFYVFAQANMYDQEMLDATYTELANTKADMRADGISSISVWTGVNKSIYEQSVGITSKAKRAAAASGNYDMLTKAKGDQLYERTFAEKCQLYAALVGGIALAVLGVAMISAVVAGLIMGCGFAALKIGTMVSVIFLCAFTTTSATVATVGLAATIFAIAGAVLVVLAVIAIIVALVFLFIWLFSDDEEPPKEAEIVYTPIPTTMYDYVDDKTFAYFDVITNTAGEAQDVNCWQQKQWVALYTSKDPRFGGPITVPYWNAADLFTVQWQTYSQTNGYSPLAFFGEKQAANLNYASKKSDSWSLYLSYNKGAKPEDLDTTTSLGKYIKDVTLKSETNEEAAKLAIKNAGYVLVDYNLTKGAKTKVKKYVNKDEYYYEDVYTYIGYTTTDDASQAVTDLRVSHATGVDGKGGQQSWGVASYGSCGYIGDTILWETKSRYAGTPILADGFHIINDIRDKQDGWEGINLFSGGIAYDFRGNGNGKFDGDEGGFKRIEKSDWIKADNNTYVFFVPEKQFKSTDPGATKYISGFGFFTGDGYNRNYVDDLIFGWEKIQGSEGLTTSLGGDTNTRTRLYVSTTYNPYRAISSIAAYEGEPNSQTAQYTFSSGGMAYVAVDVYQYADKGDYMAKFNRPSHAYVSNSYYESGCYYTTQDWTDDSDDDNPKFNLEDFAAFTIGQWRDDEFDDEDYKKSTYRSWHFPMAFYNYNGKQVMSAYRNKYLYVTGCGYTLNPIKYSEIVASGTMISDQNYTPIRSIKNWYSKDAENLCFNDIDNHEQYYLYLKRVNTTRPKYVANVKVVYNNGTYVDKTGKTQTYPTPYDGTIMALQSGGPGELVEVNLANSPESYWIYSVVGKTGKRDEDKDDMDYYRFLTSYDKQVAYIWVTYTNKAMEAICDLALTPVSSAKPANYMKDPDEVEFELCGDAFQYKGSAQYYAIYKSVAGDPITDIQLSSEPMTLGWSTAITLQNTISDYQYQFLQFRTSSSSAKSYVSKVYVGNGTDRRSALIDLLRNGCKSYVPFNISPSDNAEAYVGIGTTGSYKKAYTGFVLLNAGQNDTYEGIISTYDYEKVSENLNDATYDAKTYLMGTKDSNLAKRGSTSKKAKDWRYITEIGFFTGKDLNDYVDGIKDVNDLPANIRDYVKSLLKNEDGTVKHWDIITVVDKNEATGKYNAVNINRGAYVISGVPDEVYMYVHYNDDYTRSADLIGSVFGGPESIVLVLIVIFVMIAAAAYMVIRKKRTNI